MAGKITRQELSPGLKSELDKSGNEETQHNFTENNDEVSVDFRNKFFLIDSNNDVFYKPNGDGNAGSSLGEQGYINLWKVV